VKNGATGGWALSEKFFEIKEHCTASCEEIFFPRRGDSASYSDRIGERREQIIVIVVPEATESRGRNK